MKRLLPRLIALAAVMLGAWRIGAAWTIFSQTYDEPFHIACGMEWLDRGAYRYELQHPPLARIAAAAGLWLRGYRSLGLVGTEREGNAIIEERGNPLDALRLARIGNLFFYAAACLFLYLLARRLFDEEAAACAAALFALLPPILGHARLATTDMACATGWIVALYALDRWRARPDLLRGVGLGAAIAFGTLCKFSVIPFFGVSAMALLAGRNRVAKRRDRARSLWAAAAVFLILVGAVYRFQSIDTTFNAPNVRAALRHAPMAIQSLFTHMPFGQIVRGIAEVGYHMKVGHKSYLLGSVSTGGWWYFFPVVLACKTPPGLWLLIGAAIVLAVRNPAPRTILACAALILCVAMTSRIDLGVRHILPIYAPLCIAAGFAARQLMRGPSRWARLLAIVALLGYFVSTARSWPNELSYFNELAGPAPERILVESDLDWGQDLERLRLRLKAKRIEQFVLGYYGSADLALAGLPKFTQLSDRPASGWVAVSVSFRRLADSRGAAAFAWLDAYRPVERVGSSYDLYWIPATR